jgi:hypothetical protein
MQETPIFGCKTRALPYLMAESIVYSRFSQQNQSSDDNLNHHSEVYSAAQTPTEWGAQISPGALAD